VLSQRGVREKKVHLDVPENEFLKMSIVTRKGNDSEPGAPAGNVNQAQS